MTASDAMLSSLLSTAALKPAAPIALVASIHSTIPAGASSPAVAALAKGAAHLAGKSAATMLLGAGIAALVLTGGIFLALNEWPVADARKTPVPQRVANIAALAAPVAANPQTVTLLMIDPETDKPIGGARVEINVDGRSRPASADGKFVLTVPPRAQYLAILMRAPGQVPTGLFLSSGPFRGDFLPLYTIPMQKGTRIGGIVKDENGMPVGDADLSDRRVRRLSARRCIASA